METFEIETDFEKKSGQNSAGVDPTCASGSTNADSIKWSPYPSKVTFLLDVIDNLPRLRISGSFMKVILWLLRELGVKGVPSFDGLRKMQKLLREKQGVPTINWMTPKGNAFSFNNPITLIANVSTF